MNDTQTPGLEGFPISDAKTEFYHQQTKGEMTFENQQREFFAFSCLKARRISQKDSIQRRLKAGGGIADILPPAKLWVTHKKP